MLSPEISFFFRRAAVCLGAALLPLSASAQTTLIADSDMHDQSYSGGSWTYWGGVTFGPSTSSGQGTVGANGNPGSYFQAWIQGGVVNGGRMTPYTGPALAFSEIDDLGTFDFSFDVRVVTTTPTATLKLRPVFVQSGDEGISVLIHTGEAVTVSTQTWTTLTWSGLTSADFAVFDPFWQEPVESAAGREGTFWVGFLAEVRATQSFGNITWGVDNLTLVQTAAPPIPEPSTYAAAFGLIALGAVAWRRRRVRA